MSTFQLHLNGEKKMNTLRTAIYKFFDTLVSIVKLDESKLRQVSTKTLATVKVQKDGLTVNPFKSFVDDLDNLVLSIVSSGSNLHSNKFYKSAKNLLEEIDSNPVYKTLVINYPRENKDTLVLDYNSIKKLASMIVLYNLVSNQILDILQHIEIVEESTVTDVKLSESEILAEIDKLVQ